MARSRASSGDSSSSSSAGNGVSFCPTVNIRFVASVEMDPTIRQRWYSAADVRRMRREGLSASKKEAERDEQRRMRRESLMDAVLEEQHRLLCLGEANDVGSGQLAQVSQVFSYASQRDARAVGQRDAAAAGMVSQGARSERKLCTVSRTNTSTAVEIASSQPHQQQHGVARVWSKEDGASSHTSCRPALAAATISSSSPSSSMPPTPSPSSSSSSSLLLLADMR